MTKYGFTRDTAMAEVEKVAFPIACRLCKEQTVNAHHESNPWMTYFWLECDTCKAASPFHSGTEWEGVIRELKNMEAPDYEY